jgi:hypothetical protein
MNFFLAGWKTVKSLFDFRLRKSNYGRLDGWYIELDGEVQGELVDYQFEDMFWDSYQVIPKDDLSNEILLRQALWYGCKFKFRNKRTAQIVKALPGGSGVLNGRVSMRGLYLGR